MRKKLVIAFATEKKIGTGVHDLFLSLQRMASYGALEREPFSKIDAPSLFIIDNGFRCPGKNDLSLHHEIGPVANRQSFTDVVVRDENSDPAIAQGAHQTLNITHRKGVNPGKRLIEQDEFRFPNKRTGNFQASAFPTGQVHSVGFFQPGEAEIFKQDIRPFFLLLAGKTRII